MAEQVTYNPIFDWMDVVDDNNVPAGARIVKAADIIRWETGIDEVVRATNANSTSLDELHSTIETQGGTLATHGQSITEQGASIGTLTGRVDDLTQGASAVQYAPAAAVVTAIPSAVTTINAALTATFKVPDSGRVIVELSQFVRVGARGELRWVIADSAALATVRTTLTVANDITEQYITARALVTGLAANSDMSWVWRHQLLSPGTGTLLIDATHPALMTVRAA